jgi:hypothetical protein
MGSENFTRAIGFRLLQPADRPDPTGRYALARDPAPRAPLLELIGAPFDAVNTAVARPGVESALRPLLDVPRMSTMAIGALLNLAVAAMPPGQAFVNVGTWHGYTLLAAMAGNPDAICVGIDDFSEFGGPREESRARFEAARSPRHSFHDMDYREYLATVHEGPIGVYLYDGQNSYEGEMDALVAAEPFFADGCLLIADDTNSSQRREAMLDFALRSSADYSLVLDARTGASPHPTFWNGALVLRKCPTAAAEPPRVVGHEPVDPPGAPGEIPAHPAVTVVLLARSEGDGLAGGAERIRRQTWSDVELVVADCAPAPAAARALGAGVPVAEAPDDPGAALARALDRSSGHLVAFADTAADLLPDAVELSLAYPYAARFPRGRPDDEQRARLRTGLAAGADVDSVLAPGTPFVIASDQLGLPQTLAAGPAQPLVQPPGPLRHVDDDSVLHALAAARRGGIRHLVVMWMRFAWLDRRLGVRAHLAREWTALLDNERVRVYALTGAA